MSTKTLTWAQVLADAKPKPKQPDELTRSEIAAMLGRSHSAVDRILKAAAETGVLALGDRRVRVEVRQGPAKASDGRQSIVWLYRLVGEA